MSKKGNRDNLSRGSSSRALYNRVGDTEWGGPDTNIYRMIATGSGRKEAQNTKSILPVSLAISLMTNLPAASPLPGFVQRERI